MRFMARMLPFQAPCSDRHAAAYREQDGSKRHTGPSSGESTSW